MARGLVARMLGGGAEDIVSRAHDVTPGEAGQRAAGGGQRECPSSDYCAAAMLISDEGASGASGANPGQIPIAAEPVLLKSVMV